LSLPGRVVFVDVPPTVDEAASMKRLDDDEADVATVMPRNYLVVTGAQSPYSGTD
jgi:hypothetical protein